MGIRSWLLIKALKLVGVVEIPADSEIRTNSWFASEEEEYRTKVEDAVQGKLVKSVRANARRRRLKWHNSQSLTLDASFARLQKLFPDYPSDLVEEALLSWLEENTGPEYCSQEEMNAHTDLIDAWIDEYHSAQAEA